MSAKGLGCVETLMRAASSLPEDRFGSVASFEPSGGGDFRYYPERGHFLTLQQVTQRARSRPPHVRLGPF
jgi:hypothetical protein